MLEQELQAAVAIAREAGAIVMRVYDTDFDVITKPDDSPVTEADHRANAHIVAALSARFPDDGIVAEEDDEHVGAADRRRCWYVDPLDGTREFVRRNGEFSVMIGLAIDGRAALGVVYQPVGDRLYRGVVGQGAFLEAAGQTVPLHVSEVSTPAELRLVVSRSHRGAALDPLIADLGIKRECSSGSVGLKIGLLAERAADLYVHVSDHSSKWDACGPEAILRAAGGRFTDLRGNDFIYRGEDMKNRTGILASNGAAHAAVLPAAREVAREMGLS